MISRTLRYLWFEECISRADLKSIEIGNSYVKLRAQDAHVHIQALLTVKLVFHVLTTIPNKYGYRHGGWLRTEEYW